jgi:RND superfamily putative drug exporter
MFYRLGKFVAQRPKSVVCTWVAIVILLRFVAPSWNEVTKDGDFAYLPAEMPSVLGEKMQATAFPDLQAKSEFVVIVARTTPLAEDLNLRVDQSRVDAVAARDLIRRFEGLYGEAMLVKAWHLEQATDNARNQTLAKSMYAQAAELFDDAIADSQQMADFIAEHPKKFSDQTAIEARLQNQKQLWVIALEKSGQKEEAAEVQSRFVLQPNKAEGLSLTDVNSGPSPGVGGNTVVHPRTASIPWRNLLTYQDTLPIFDLQSEDISYLRDKLIATQEIDGRPFPVARLVILKISNEFMSTDNIGVFSQVRQEVDSVRNWVGNFNTPDSHVEIGISGSTAVGGDALTSAKESIDNTELFAIILVALILLFVYRAPLMVAVPLLSIATSLVVAMPLVALLTQVDQLPGFGWWDFKVFKTTKIFVVVILYGAGTDYCLFLISRYREELAKGAIGAEAMARTMAGVGDALAASALTTILGLAMMFFADFGKFSYSGPMIGLCLAITLLACVTLAPALLVTLSGTLFWPSTLASLAVAPKQRAVDRLWDKIAGSVLRRPGLILIASLLLMLPFAVYGWNNGHKVSYDFLGGLDPNRESRQGAKLVEEYFLTGQNSPVVVLAQTPATPLLDSPEKAGDTPNVNFESRNAIFDLTKELYDVPGVLLVRSFGEPFGGKPVQVSTWTNRALRSNGLVQARYISPQQVDQFRTTRFEVVLSDNPFSLEATQTVARLEEFLQKKSEDPDSFWHDSKFGYTGTAAGIRDLRQVTESDNQRIMVLVVLAVFCVLVLILRRPVVCVYMILSVLFSYYVTIGLATLILSAGYGPDYPGLDWKTPLFLFVILVAIGQDYNVYLATRVFEEQEKRGPFAGIREAMVRTGSIITSCGVIMAGTFVSMTSSTWGFAVPDGLGFLDQMFPNGGGLRSIVELGTALSLGVILDTFVVRPILVPAFLVFLAKWQVWWQIREGES